MRRAINPRNMVPRLRTSASPGLRLDSTRCPSRPGLAGCDRHLRSKAKRARHRGANSSGIPGCVCDRLWVLRPPPVTHVTSAPRHRAGQAEADVRTSGHRADTIRSGGTSPEPASTSSARCSSSSKPSSGGGPEQDGDHAVVAGQSAHHAGVAVDVHTHRVLPGKSVTCGHVQDEPLSSLRQFSGAALRAGQQPGQRPRRAARAPARTTSRTTSLSLETTTTGRPCGSAATSSRITSSAITPARL